MMERLAGLLPEKVIRWLDLLCTVLCGAATVLLGMKAFKQESPYYLACVFTIGFLGLFGYSAGKINQQHAKESPSSTQAQRIEELMAEVERLRAGKPPAPPPT